MLFLIFSVVAIILTASIVWSMITRATDRRNAVAKMRSLWGKPAERFFAGLNPTLYHNCRLENADEPGLDDQTWEDLYLTDVFRLVDHTRSRVGSQMLYHLLRTPSVDRDEIVRRGRLISLFESAPELRVQIQAALDPLENDDAGQLPNLFYGEIPPRPAEYFLYPLLTICGIAVIGFVIYKPIFWPYLLPLLSINMGVAGRYRTKVKHLTHPLRVLSLLVQSAEQIGKLGTASSDPEWQRMVQALQENGDALKVLDRATRWLRWEQDATAGMTGILVEYVNMILMLDINAFVFSIESVRHNRSLIQHLFEMVGTIDALVAVASYRHTLPYFCVPTFTAPDKQLHLVDALHPLLNQGVTNSVTLEKRSILITGSNMSGKTTFIRTVAINTVLAQTISTCLAKEYRAAPMYVHSSIGRTDSLSEGKSYYIAEVEGIAEFLSYSVDSTPCLFIIDEIFRGTNTTERVAASKAVLDALNRADGPHVVLVSTHDIELSFLLETAWDRYHFLESVVDGELVFDYKMRTGLCSSRNALRLLASRDYPAAVVADAEATAARIDIVKA